jgi:type III restriction enzyme
VEFRFDANQEFQVKAIEAVADLFDGQAPVSAQVRFKEGTISLAAIDNRLDLDNARVLANLQTVQRGNGIQPDAKLECIEETINTNGGQRVVRFPNFSVEMETGTGKTYVYIRTILELFSRYGMRKFIVVVPSVAVREGVLKTLKITEKHLKALYGNPVYLSLPNNPSVLVLQDLHFLPRARACLRGNIPVLWPSMEARRWASYVWSWHF